MSSRQLRKLQKQRELEQAKGPAGNELDESDEDTAPSPVAAKPRVSLFAALGGGDDEEGDEGELEGEKQDDGESQSQAAKEEEDEDQSHNPPESGKKSKKKKKKKKGGKNKAKAQEKDGASEDDIDKVLEELKLGSAGGDADSSSSAAAAAVLAIQRRINTLLGINTNHLKAINEMRQLFGRDIIESANAEEERENNNRRRRGPAQQQVDLETFLRGPPVAKRLPEVSLRRNVFIQGREHWPLRSAGGLGMKQLHKAADGSYTEYAYVHDKDYDAIQAVFFAYVQIGDPMRIVYLLQQCPYHVSTLLQVSSVAKQDQNMALAAELCERALFTFGRVATSAFRQDLENGKARLDFRRPENRQFWLAGYHYLKSLLRKGTYRTALEWSKLMFALDTSDPYAMRHFIHFIAVRAHEAEWLIDFIDELENISDNRDTAYLRQSTVLAKLQLQDLDGARAELTNGMKRVPWLYCALFQELGLDAPPSIWGISIETSSRNFWVKLYIHQTKDLWNNTGAISLLKEVAKSLDKVQTSELPADDAPPDLGATRLAYLEGQTSIIALAPREILDRQPNYEFDPLPPLESENIFSGEGCRLPWKDSSQGSRAMEHQIEMQLRNLMARQQAAGGAGAGGPGAGAFPGAFGVDEDDDEIAELDAIDMDDPELRADLEEHARRIGQPGWLDALMQVIRGQPRMADADDVPAGAGQEDEQREELLPGSWPAEDEDEGGQHQRRDN
ncbi:unnamed protein product [Clonostachys rosea f. rosea IK726]|uniref:Uncharacterized protein n=1 Tax=Clonostachys rosea f. rosea IK726 TaxID=1349383 RepID=A0ACA9TTI7_BIOOC|nr:unnamed protein product [Clonostachys rosea f. rosea IK726]